MYSVFERHPRFTVLGGTLFLLGLVWFLCFVVIGLSINLLPHKPIERLEQAMALWNSKGIDNYRMTMQIFIPLVAVGQFTVTVQNGEVVEHSQLPLGQSRDWIGNYYSFLGLSTDPNQYSMEQLFDLAVSKLEPIPAPYIISVGGNDGILYDISFDSELGYISTYTHGECGGKGLFSPAMADCPSGFRVIDFEILDRPA